MEPKFLVDSNGRSFWSGANAPGPNKPSSEGQGPQQLTENYNRDDHVPTKPTAAMSFGQRVRIARIWQSHEELIGQTIRVAGWAKKKAMDKKEFAFVEIGDGSCHKTVQAVVQCSIPGFDKLTKANMGASVIVKGKLITSPAKGQPFELALDDPKEHRVEVYGNTDDTYPLQGRPKEEVSNIQSNV